MATQAQIDQAMLDLTAATAAETTVVGSAIVALNGFPAQMQKALDDYKGANPTVTDAQVAGMQASIDAQTKAASDLAAAIPANVPPAG